MKYKEIIRIFAPPKQLSIIDRARYIAGKQNEISCYFDKFDWILFDKTPVDLSEKEQVIQLLLKRIKREIKGSTTLTILPDDFIDDVSSGDGFFASKKYSDDAVITHRIGATGDYDKFSTCIIKNFYSLRNLNEFIKLKEFIIKMIELFDPQFIEISEHAFYRDMMNLESDEYWFGWMTYFSKDIKIPQIPSDVKVEELPNGGKLLITTEDFFNCDNPEHVRKARSLVELFRKNNIKV